MQGPVAATTYNYESHSQWAVISFSGENIPFQFSFLKIYTQQTRQEKKLELITRHTTGNNPKYAERLTTVFVFEKSKSLIVEIYACTSTGLPLNKFGEVTTSIGSTIRSRINGVSKTLNKTSENIVIHCERIKNTTKHTFYFDLFVRTLNHKSYWCCENQPDHFYSLHEIKGNSNPHKFFESIPTHKKQVSQKQIEIREIITSQENIEPVQRFALEYYQNFNDPQLVGQVFFTMEEMKLSMKNGSELNLGQKQVEIMLSNFKKKKEYCYTDFLSAGLVLELQVYIDFTASNDDYTRPNSKHYKGSDRKQRSQYEEVLSQVVKILIDYDYDELVPAYGFGATVKSQNHNSFNKVHHCFPLNGKFQYPALFKLEGILQAYNQLLPFLKFSGPTLIAPLLREAIADCQSRIERYKENIKQLPPPNQYKILLILTDGRIHDEGQFIDLLVKCSKLPISIIIVGIGQGEDTNDWQVMHQLDDDQMILKDSKGNGSTRDLVQFVQFDKHNRSSVDLAEKVLEELPKQIEEYHLLNGITPDYYRRVIQPAISQRRENSLS